MERGKLTIPIEGENVPFYPYNSFDEVLQTADDESVTLRMVLEGMDAAIALLQSSVAQKANAEDVYPKAQTYTKTEVDNALSAKANKATTLSGYGITNAYTKNETDISLGGKADKTQLDNYLPLAGGTMVGDLGFANGDFSFKVTDDGKNLDIGWDYEARKGAGLGLRSVNNAGAGQFLLYARNGVNTCTLIGKPDGGLIWNERNVVTEGDISNMLTTASKIQSVRNGSNVTAPNVSGYKFLCWLQPATDGWVGSPYMVNPSNSTSSVYSAVGMDNVDQSVTFTALYVKV